MIPGIAGSVIGEPGTRHRRGGDAIFYFQLSAVRGDTRRASVSATYPENYGIAVLLDLFPHFRLIREHDAFLPLQDCFHLG